MTREGIAFSVYFLFVTVLMISQVPETSSPPANYVLKPLQSGVETVHSYRRSVLRWFETRRALNERLDGFRDTEQEKRRLEYRIRQLETSNQRLREQLELAGTLEPTFVLAEVVQQELGPWRSQVRLRLSEDHNLEPGTGALVFEDGQARLWGVVDSVSSGYAQVIGVRDPRFQLGVILEGFDDRHWVISGDGQNGMLIEPFPVYLEVEPGTEVRASPASSLVKDQWFVGTVRERNPESGSVGDVSLRIEPAAPSSIDFLWFPPDDD